MTVLAGIGIIAVLSMGYGGFQSILTAAAIGAIISIPVAWVLARKVVEL
ncbi:MAG: CTP synthetase [Paracoccus sp. (in: a-proteobacteria)]